MKRKYISRIIEPDILAAAREFPVVVLTGPRQTGKSTLLTHLFPSHAYVTLDDPMLQRLATDDPELFLSSYPVPVIIDEIQCVPGRLPYIKMKVDADRGANGQYLLTGSQMFSLMQGVTESLAGRAVLFELLGFSSEELSYKKKQPSLDDCFARLFEHLEK